MKFGKPYKSIAAIAASILLLQGTLQGQAIIDTQTVSKEKKLLSSECNLTDYESEYIFTKIDILASFKNSSGKWFEYAQKNFDFNSVVQQLPDTCNYFRDSIIVRFIVTKSGLVCRIETLKGNLILADPAIRLLKMSAQWHPASSEGRQLNAYRTLKIDVLIDRQKYEFKIIRNFKSYFNPDG